MGALKKKQAAKPEVKKSSKKELKFTCNVLHDRKFRIGDILTADHKDYDMLKQFCK